MPDQNPRAFLSYTRIDDRRDGGRITNLREQLSGEVQVQTGKPFEIFQDVKDIQLGQSWRDRIETALDEVTFLIPILTPGFFNSEACRDEVLRFLEHERQLGRNDLLLPVYYVNHPPFNSQETREGDEVAVAMAAHQWIDWRDLRHQSSTSATVARMLESIAIQIRDALNRIAASGGSAVSQPSATGRATAPDAEDAREETGEAARETEPRGPAEKTELTTLVVDQSGAGQFTAIGEANEAANPGDRILVRSGVYREGLIIEKPLDISGDGSVDKIVIEARGKSALLFRATMGRVANLSLRQVGGGPGYGVNISQGRLVLEDCDINSQTLACISVDGGASPAILRNRIHDGAFSGILVEGNSQGTIEDNDIFGNDLSGIVVRDGGNPTARRNRIHDGKGPGVFVHTNGEGTFEDNDVFGNAQAGIAVRDGGKPTVRRNRIHDGKASGVFVYDNGEGTIEDNDIFGNAFSGVTVADGGNPTVRGNRVHRNGHAAVRVTDAGGGTFEDNDLRDNQGGSWSISSASRAKVTRARNRLT